jgi:hypothetical protein
MALADFTLTLAEGIIRAANENTIAGDRNDVRAIIRKLEDAIDDENYKVVYAVWKDNSQPGGVSITTLKGEHRYDRADGYTAFGFPDEESALDAKRVAARVLGYPDPNEVN